MNNKVDPNPKPSRGVTRKYKIYQPEITDHVVLRYNQAGLKYRHVSAMAFFQGRFYMTWNANTIYAEAVPGQVCYIASSPDGKNWSEPTQVTPNTSVPGGIYEKANVQWQGGLLNWQDRELWFFWCEHPNAAVHLSVLKTPDGEWTDRVILRDYPIDGINFMPFVHNNSIVLSSGRIMHPVLFQDYRSCQQTENPTEWRQTPKYSGALVSDDEGKNWHVEEGTLIKTDPPPDPGGDSFVGVWEPMYVLQRDGRVRAFSRTSGNRIVTAIGDRAGTTMGPWKVSSMRTLQSRFWVGAFGDRRVMVHHDDYGKSVDWTSRRNLALFFSRTGEDDFVAGNTIVGRDVQIQYPHGLVHDGRLYVGYTYDFGHELRCAVVDSLPSTDAWYVFPRGDRRGLGDFDNLLPECRAERIFEDGREILFMRGNAAAGVDIDPLDPARDTLTLRVPVKIENAERRKMKRLLCVGDGQVMLGYDNQGVDRLHICIDGQWQDATAFAVERWLVVTLEISAKGITVDVDGSSRTFPPASGFSGRVYLGDGFPDGHLSGCNRYRIDITRLESSVSPGEE